MVQDDNNWQKHPDLYMSDGTMVLLANTTLFRVYAGLLSRHSVVFEGLMDSSQHVPDNGDVYDGCPLVRLHDDPEDVAYFLKALLNLGPFERGLPTPYPTASAILRLASKYMVPFLRQRAVEHFKRIIPPSYNDIGKEEPYAQVFGSDKAGWPHHFQLLALFREHRLRSLLPWIYYSACALGFEILLQGDTTHDGKIICLDAHDFHITLLGWKALCIMTHEVRNNALNFKNADRCSSCRKKTPWSKRETFTFETQAMYQWGKFKVLTYADGQTLPPDLRSGEYYISHSDRPCQYCYTEWLGREGDARAKIWPGLPAIFNLPDWEALKQEEESVEK